MSTPSNTFGAKLGRAFKWHWNLLAFGAGVAVALLSGKPDIALPLVLAGELGYLGFLGLNDRFQRVLVGKEMLENKEVPDSTRKLREMIAFLNPKDRERFESLRERAVSFKALRDRMNAASDSNVLSELRTGSLDKMLWLFLKLLHHKSGLQRFIDTTEEGELVGQLESAKADQEKARVEERSPALLRSMQEKTDAINERLKNYRAAEDSLELINTELDKTEQRIAHISEVGMTSRVPSDLGIQIDGIAESMASSEATLGDLTSGLDFEEDEIPSMVSAGADLVLPPPLPGKERN